MVIQPKRPASFLVVSGLLALSFLAFAPAKTNAQVETIPLQADPVEGASARLFGTPATAETRENFPATTTDPVEIVYDDGETDAGITPGGDAYLDIVMRFDLPQGGMRVDQLSVCLGRQGNHTDLELNFSFWAADGPGGSPGSFITSVPATAHDIPTGPTSGFMDFDFAVMGTPVVLPSSTVYIGVGWPDHPPDDDFFLCYDADSPLQPGYVDVNHQENWIDLSENTSPDIPPYTALLLRGTFSEPVPTGPCVPDDITMCLLDGRFKVQVEWHTEFGTTGPGHVVPFGSNKAGLFWFFNADNWEMLVKMLDACTLDPPRFWVFFAATTNVEFTMTVTDTQTGVPKVYHNDLGHRADAVTDTGAFDTCP